MKIRSTGIANMNMVGKVVNIHTSTDDIKKILVMEIMVQKPRKWDVMVKVDADDLKEILRLIAKPTFLWKLLLVLIFNK